MNPGGMWTNLRTIPGFEILECIERLGNQTPTVTNLDGKLYVFYTLLSFFREVDQKTLIRPDIH